MSIRLLFAIVRHIKRWSIRGWKGIDGQYLQNRKLINIVYFGRT